MNSYFFARKVDYRLMDLESSYTGVCQPCWTEVWIVGGGPSALAFDPDRLRGKRVLTVNDSVFRFCYSYAVALNPSMPAFFTLDKNWIRRHRDFLNKYTGEKYLAVPLETWPDCAGISGARYLQWAHGDGLNEDPHFINTGGHSGYGAFNVAFLKRSSEIHLVGFDLDPAQKSQYVYWARNYDTMIPQLKAAAVKVFNHNRESYITAFPRVD
jgi:hypothetical protein